MGKFLLVTLLVFGIGISSVFAQQNSGKITGKIVDAQNKAVGYATVTLLKQDSSVAGGDVTTEDGDFTITKVAAGSYRLHINGIGIKSRIVDGISISSESPNKDLGKIKTFSAAQQLKGVEVTAEKNLMEMSVDKKVFNVDKNLTAVGGSATDVLQNVPSVSVDVDGSISLRGKSNVTILIDGKPATMFGGDAASALQSLPAASIQSVEVITNPSSKYDAQGMTGILNIITKRDKKFGLNGSVTAGVGTHEKYNGSLNLNLKNNKWNVFLNSSFRLNKNYNYTLNERVNAGTHDNFKSEEDNLRMFNGFFNSIGAEYTINKNNTITLTENINKMQWGGDGTSNYTVNTSNILSNYIQRRSSYNVGGPLSFSTSLDYKHKFKKEKQELTGNANFSSTHVERNQEYETSILNTDGTQRMLPISQKAPGSGNNRSVNAQADFTSPLLTKTGKLEAGLKTQLYWFDSKNNPTIDSGTGVKTDYNLLNVYNYKQQVYSAYTNFSDQKGKWSYQGGLRLEYAYYEGTIQTISTNTYNTSFLNLFPSAYVSYKLPKDQTVYVNYSRRTNRPDFRQMMPFKDISNPQDTSMGNPNLRPEFINNAELNYNKQFKKGHNIIVGAYYQYTESMIERYRKFYADGTSFTQPQNLNTGVTYGLEVIGKAQILKAWDATLSFNFFQNEVHGANIDPLLNNSGASWYTKLNTNIKLPANFSIQINGNYEAPKVASQGTLQEVYWLDVAVRKNVLKGKGTFVVNVSDIFNTRKYTTVYDYPLYTQTTYRVRETRVGNFSFTYRFGKSDIGKDQPKGMNNSGGGRKGGKDQSNKTQSKERDNLKTDENSDSGGTGQGNPAPSGN
ncbi:MAG: TonB-dependent receptor [Bacteroidetes bacterium]|nr:TonB-dependent receptor [Bacteroidota bacterium]